MNKNRLWTLAFHLVPSLSLLRALRGPLSLPFSERNEIGPSVMSESREKGKGKGEKEKTTGENADRNASHHTRRCVRASHKAPFTTSCLGTNSRLLSNYSCCVPARGARERVCENVCDFHTRVTRLQIKKPSLQTILPRGLDTFRASCPHEGI